MSTPEILSHPSVTVSSTPHTLDTCVYDRLALALLEGTGQEDQWSSESNKKGS